MSQTSTLKLNKPNKGTFDWDVPINANWDILDKLGGTVNTLSSSVNTINTSLSSKANTNLNNISSNFDLVTETRVSNGNWYKKYKSGWIVQGGISTFTAVQVKHTTITLPKPMSNSNYAIYITPITNNSSGSLSLIAATSSDITNTNFMVNTQGADSKHMAKGFSWAVYGQGA